MHVTDERDRAGAVSTAQRPTSALDRSCPACLGDGRPLTLVADGRYRLIRCRGCGTEYFRPDSRLAPEATREPVSEYWEGYKFDLYADPAVQRDYERRYRAVLDRACRRVGPVHSVLDVGCGIGNFVAYAQSLSIASYGIDVDADAVSAARDRGLRVAVSDDLDRLLGTELVDAVTLWDVIEHLYDPEPVLRDVLRKLRPGGALLLETPDAAFPVRRACLAARAATRGRLDVTGHLYYWEHKIYFTQAGLTALLRRVGCEVVHVARETSPKAKMQAIFGRYAHESVANRLIARIWPVTESAIRRAGRGNKLIMVARATRPGDAAAR